MQKFFRRSWKLWILLGALFGIFLYWNWANGWKSKTYAIASGQPGAGYHAVTEGLLEISEKEDTEIRLREVLSDGSVENRRLVVDGSADFGLTQLGGELDDDLRAITHVYNDVLHILVREGSNLSSISELRGKKIATGLPHSGTRVVARQLLQHYGLSDSQVNMLDVSPEESVKLLVGGKVEAVILVTSVQAPVIMEAMQSGVVKHFSLGDVNEQANEASGFCQRYRIFKATTIPKHLFGCSGKMQVAKPSSAVSVVSVPSIVVCRKEMDTKIVYELTRGIFANKHVLSKHSPAMQQMSEPKDFDAFVYPLHDGAKAYYQRRSPGFLVVYAEVIALMLSGSIALIGLISAARQWSAVKHKNRIDEYYKKLIISLRQLRAGEVDPIEEEKILVGIQTQAYEELVSEKLFANESFRIFQDLLEQCLKEARRAKRD